ncbi:cyclic nucleotide-binding domain-containing protein [uncultured Pontibacter sp.]|uniref:cyclic nucleotide-binding domain-containing protein n=1 Tax=uncultured Pontibacter sp. TaxID=453356 RepID=UPI002623938F|nr:cyclic nucleotide-binding domain-containing protein [uncultured Pontibacter sp.]
MPIRDFIEQGILTGEPAIYESGSYLFRQGERTYYFYLVTSGSVLLEGTAANMDEKIVAPPDFLLGITDLLNDVYSFTALASETTFLIRIDKQELQRAIQLNPSLRLYLIKQMIWEAAHTNTAFE